MNFDEVVYQRRSVRGFQSDRLVPADVLAECLQLAQQTPSNCNVQPWRVFVASGAGCQRVRRALLTAIDAGQTPDPEDAPDEFPQPYRQLQVDCAKALYKEMGVARDDHAGRLRALLRNFEFFDAPHVAILCMEKYYGLGVALDVGMWLQTFLLALASRGIGSCAQASLRQYPQVLRRELAIPDTLRILCGVSFGYEAPDVPANRCRQPRDPLEKNVTIFNE